jgi:signal transduction histidine kinase
MAAPGLADPRPPPLAERLIGSLARVTPAGWARVDAVAATVAFVGFTTPALLGHPSQDGAPAAVVSFGAAAFLPLAVRRRWPLAVLVVVVTSTALATMLGVRFTPFVSNAGPQVALATYTVVERFGRRASLAAVAATFSTSWIAIEVAAAAHPQQDHDAVHAVAALGGWLVGDTVRARRAYRRELAIRKQHEGEQHARRGIAEERLRISREVHDVVSHSLSVIAVQAGVGRLVFDTQPDKARAALAEVESLSHRSLNELRRLFGSIREPRPHDAVPGVNESLGPVPSLDDLVELVEGLAAGGMDVGLDLIRPQVTLSPMLELTAYRIVQESLTNVIKHAGRTSARVTVRPGPGALHIDIVDTGPPTATPTGRRAAPAPDAAEELRGWGIAGMRERAALFGGTVTAGPRAAGGFRVSARLPVAESTSGASR